MQRIAATATVLVGLAVLPATVSAHLERTSYWPDPRPDTGIFPPAGGEVPKVRSLASALDDSRPGATRVVCQSDSLARERAALDKARSEGYRFRPSSPLRHLSARSVRYQWRLAQRLFAVCGYHEVQPAVTASGNQDRVVVMPGLYTEPTSRAVPAFPPACEQYRTTSDKGPGAVSYTYQFHCPNAQALVAVIGHGLGPGADPPTSPTGRPDPHGIPNLGPCIRCNLQLEGSGPTPDDVVIDAGRAESGNAAPLGSKKDVGIKADRADGFVLRNMTVRHAAEHDVYILETDGYRQDRMKFFYAGEYGTLMFTSDHGLTNVCEGVGNGDSAVYPGGAPDTGAERDRRFYPDQRYNQVITHCDLHHNNMASSGTMGNAVRYTENNVYDNASGFVTDSFYAGGHPGFPEDSTLYDHNRVYSNNFDVYGKGSDVKSAVSVPIGVGALIAGGNSNQVRDNYIYDNWRRGTMLISVPDVIACAPSPNEGSPPCAPKSFASVSNDNVYRDNVMGRSPEGQVLPNGVDFWWDSFPSNQGNCWYPNIGSGGTAASITSDPAPPPAPGMTVPGMLPEDCSQPALGVGTGDPAKEAMLVNCAGFLPGSESTCEWYVPPARPGTKAAAAQRAREQRIAEGLVGKVTIDRFCQLIGGQGGTLACSPFRQRP